MKSQCYITYFEIYIILTHSFVFPTTSIMFILYLFPIHIDNRRVNYNKLLGLFSHSFNGSCSLKHINSVVFKCQMKKIKKEQKQKEINAILSLDGSRVYTIVNDAGLNGVVFNCLPVKVNSTDGVVLYILPFFSKKQNEKIKERIDSDKHTLPMNKTK